MYDERTPSLVDVGIDRDPDTIISRADLLAILAECGGRLFLGLIFYVDTRHPVDAPHPIDPSTRYSFADVVRLVKHDATKSDSVMWALAPMTHEEASLFVHLYSRDSPPYIEGELLATLTYFIDPRQYPYVDLAVHALAENAAFPREGAESLDWTDAPDEFPNEKWGHKTQIATRGGFQI